MNLKKLSLLIFMAAGVILLSPVIFAQPSDTIVVAGFSAAIPGEVLPEAWRPYTFQNWPRVTQYTLVEDEGKVGARAAASTLGVARQVQIDPKTYPILAWRWKVSNVLQKSDIHTQAGDDSPARIFVVFDLDLKTLPRGERVKLRIARLIYGRKLPLAVLCYVWDSKAPVGALFPNAYSDRVQTIVAQRGAAKLKQWVKQERSVVENYQRAFGT